MKKRGLVWLLTLLLSLGFALPGKHTASAAGTIGLRQALVYVWEDHISLWQRAYWLTNPDLAPISPDVARVAFMFDQVVDPNTVPRAISITDSHGNTPAFTGPVLPEAGNVSAETQYELTFPEPLAPNETYTLVIKGGPDGVRDWWGSTLTSDIRLTFRTGDAPPALQPYPAVTRLMADNNMFDLHDGAAIGRGQPFITVFFNRAMDLTSVRGAVRIQDSHGRVPRYVVMGAGDQFPIDFDEPLRTNETYTIRVKGGSAGVMDRDGNLMPNDYSITFKTGDEPVDFDLHTRTSWDASGAIQTDVFPMDVAAGNLTVSMPFYPVRQYTNGIGDEITEWEIFDLTVLFYPPDQPPQTVITGRVQRSGTTDIYGNPLPTVKLARSGHYEVRITPRYVAQPHPDRKVSIRAVYQDSVPGGTVPVIPPFSPEGLQTYQIPFAVVFGQPGSSVRSLSIGVDGAVIAEHVLTQAGRVTIDPAVLADGVHAITVAAQASDSPNKAMVSRPFVARRPRFGDVGPSHWAYLPVELESQRGILNGTGGGEFQPDRPSTRAEFAKMLALSLGLPADSSAPAATPFADVPAGAWYAPYVQALASRGIIKGEAADGKLYFQPDRLISREEAATIIPRSVPLTAAAPHTFADQNKVQAWALPGVQALQGVGWITGFPDGTFQPKGSLTRGQAAKILANVPSVK